jgi:NitT/TauT family transport system ATP-binding protein
VTLTTSPPLMNAQNISHYFGSGAGRFDALTDVSLSIAQGQFISIVGPSGCGKSTLMQILGGLIIAAEGNISIDGVTIDGPHPDKIGIVFQEALLLPWKNALENIMFPLDLIDNLTSSEKRHRAHDMLALVGLSHAAHLYPHEMSGGMRQRIAIARGLVRQPRLLLMDEPFGALDEQTRTRMWGELLSIHARSGASIVFITHSLVEAVYLADDVMVMAAHPGRIIEHIKVDLPRPRDVSMIGSDYVGSMRNHIWSLIAGPSTL